MQAYIPLMEFVERCCQTDSRFSATAASKCGYLADLISGCVINQDFPTNTTKNEIDDTAIMILKPTATDMTKTTVMVVMMTMMFGH